MNGDYTPLNICSKKRAILLVLSNKVDVLKSCDSYMISQREMFAIPSVVRLRYQVRKPYSSIPLSKKNVYVRDYYTCQYCGSHEKLTIDHVIPLKHGGKSTWENLVTCCFKCNNKKGDTKLEHTTFKLMSQPKKPGADLIFKYSRAHNKDWEDFIPE